MLGRESSHALTVRAAFDPLSAMADEWMERARLIHVTDIGQVEDMAFARESRLGLRKVVGLVERERKQMKADLLTRGREIDKVAGDLEEKIRPVMDHLREQEEFAIRYEAARRAELHAARSAQLVALGADPKAYAFADASDEGFVSILNIARAVRDVHLEADRLAEVARVEAERIAAEAREAARAEKARLDAERLERERVQAEENARLKVEREAAAEALRLERAERDAVEARFAAEREAERQAAEHAQAERDRRDAIAAEALRIEREAAAAIAREKDEAARVEREKVEAVARKAKEEHEALLRRIADQEHRAKLEAAAERERAEALAEEARLAPDREKLQALAEQLQAFAEGRQVTLVLPEMSTDAGRAALTKIATNGERYAASVEKAAGGL